MELQIFEPKNQQEFENIMDYLNESAEQYFDAVYAECMNDETFSLNSKQVFNDWWNRKSIYNNQYKLDHPEYSEKDIYDGHSLILWAVGQGCG